MVGFHDHPRRPKDANYKMWDPNYILSVVQNRDHRIGACADTGHWVRIQLQNPLTASASLKSRVISSHLKDSPTNWPQRPRPPLRHRRLRRQRHPRRTSNPRTSPATFPSNTNTTGTIRSPKSPNASASSAATEPPKTGNQGKPKRRCRTQRGRARHSVRAGHECRRHEKSSLHVVHPLGCPLPLTTRLQPVENRPAKLPNCFQQFIRLTQTNPSP